MSLHEDLLVRADVLASLDARRPKQANLRDAVSSAYYALFHLLTSEASGAMASAGPLQPLVARAFSHAEMKRASRQFQSGNLAKRYDVFVGQQSLPADLRTVASAFADLQQMRHEADYDTQRTFTRNEARFSIRRARSAFEAWGRVRKHALARLFLYCLLFDKQWERVT